ncbi:ATP-binding protein, partial [Patescibacteria group bacterium]|nr:ATP-binding protein [Patescibacteria group bacterium]
MEKVAKEIVLTGGPCSGKTTAINYIAEKLRDKGFRVFVVQEFATMLILAGVGNLNKLEERDPERYLKVEEQMLLMHLETRKRFNAIARIFNNEKS